MFNLLVDIINIAQKEANMEEFGLDRFRNIGKFVFNCEVITPMFLGGADTQNTELRESSFKGVLRFWWRALCGSSDIKEMRRKESEIFGSTEKKSNISIRVETKSKPKEENLPKGEIFKVFSKSKNREFRLGIIDYLAYGFYEYKKEVRSNVYIRHFFDSKSEFSLNLIFDKEYENEILTSLYFLTNYGGLGSRSRNGFGCFSIHEDLKIDKPDFKNKDMLSFTAFSKSSKLFVFNTHDKWVDALSEIGMAYREARLSLENKHNFEKRGMVAKPIEAKYENIPPHIKNGRHAKSYFLHVSKTKDGKYQGQILYLPYKHKEREYFNVYDEMNKTIEKKAKEVKHEF